MLGVVMQTATSLREESVHAPSTVKILLALDNVPARLTLEALLDKSGYSVDSAASSAEAMEKIENEQYSLVLCNLREEAPDACQKVIRLARTQEYKPATAYLTMSSDRASSSTDSEDLLIEPVEVPALLTKIADLIGTRAAGRARRAVRSKST